MATIYQRFLGRFTLGDTLDQFQVDATPPGSYQTVSLDTGKYYIEDAGSGECLVTEMQAQIRADTAAVNALVTYSYTTNRITIDPHTGANSSVKFTLDSAVKAMLGFTADEYTGATTYTAENPPQFTWSPEEPISEYPTDLDQWFALRSTTRTTRSKEGTTYSAQGNNLYDGGYAWNLLSASNVIKAESTGSDSLEDFFEDVIANGEIIKAYPDTTDSLTYYDCMFPAEDDDGIGSFRDFTERHIQSYNGLWDVGFDLWKHIT